MSKKTAPKHKQPARKHAGQKKQRAESNPVAPAPTGPVKAELLAPAGSLEAFFAAMEAGADAVYCGLHSFSARAKAKNFSVQDLSAMSAYAHERGRKLFVTINTLVKEEELPQLVDTLFAVSEARVDAVILQDLAVWRLAREHFPELELHASTQMTVHNAAGVKQLEQMGFTRAVLARELTLEEVAHIRSRTQMELEHFIHGALCFCFSGQCMFSSYLGGKSGNRGRCAQPCRRRYNVGGKHGYYFSPNDLSVIDLLPDLEQAGVSSFKIEGRMKSAEYVANVVSAYRLVMDAPPAQQNAAREKARKLLKYSFGRTPTQGFLSGEQPADLATPQRRGSTGRFLGDVTRVDGGRLSFKSKDKVLLGDRVRVQPRNDQVGTAFTVKQMFAPKGKVNAMGPGLVCAATPFKDRFRVGDAVYKVSSQQAFSMSDTACRKRLQQVKPPARPLDLKVALQDDKLHLHAQVDGVELSTSYTVEVFPAQQSPLDAATLEQVFGQSGNHSFQLRNLEMEELPAVIIPPKQLKQIRREFYASLDTDLSTELNRRRKEQRQRALADLRPAVPGEMLPPDTSLIVRDLREMRAMETPDVERVIVPLSAAVMHRRWKVSPRQQRSVVWDIPFIVFDREWEGLQQAVHYLISCGFEQFRLNNISHFRLFSKHPEVQLETSYRLFCLNSYAARAWHQLGASSGELYLEDDSTNMASVVRNSNELPLRVLVYSSIAMLTSRIKIPKIKGDKPIVSDRGDQYRVRTSAGLTVLSAEGDFSLCEYTRELMEAGSRGAVLDLSHLGVFSPEGKQVLDTYRQGRKVPGTTQFNYVTGLE
ncbi:MAG: peptidase U32 family protein [Thermodesulfobacteriota bacterium]